MNYEKIGKDAEDLVRGEFDFGCVFYDKGKKGEKIEGVVKASNGHLRAIYHKKGANWEVKDLFTGSRAVKDGVVKEDYVDANSLVAVNTEVICDPHYSPEDIDKFYEDFDNCMDARELTNPKIVTQDGEIQEQDTDKSEVKDFLRL